ncbi:MAG: restriction endonuclease subunit S [Chloroflexota bacterium]|nr:restriction endonuclease subunit S [Chloroflexota bacterium]
MTSPVDIRPDHLEIVQDILVKNLPAGVKVWVFGSRANWTTKDSSDLDLALEGEGKLSHKVLGALKDAFEDSSLPYTVDVVDFNRIGDAFKQIVELQRAPLPLDRVVTYGADLTGTSGEWREMRLGDCITIGTSTYSPREAWPFINYLETGNITDNRISGFQRLVPGRDKIPSRARRKVREGDIVYSTVRPNQRHFGIITEVPDNLLVSTGFAVIRGKDEIATTDFVFWYLAQDSIVAHLHTIAEHSVSAYPSIKPSDIEQLSITLPPLPEQCAIAHILGTLDDKIELNRRMNETLEGMARALFKSWFVDFDPVRAKMEGRDTGLPPHIAALFPDRLVPSELGEIPEGWTVKPLDEIAKFRNGLALQKHRPKDCEDWLPVLKIAQLRAGSADGKERASVNIRPDCIVNDGDVIFSWSGSLLVKVWFGGRVALNQHLFKVTSEESPKWFFLQNLRSHLAFFQSIAAGKATTMGHIKRHHLNEALCAVPDSVFLSKADSIFDSILERQIGLGIQSRSLAAQRDALLPGLVSGELQIDFGWLQ